MKQVRINLPSYVSQDAFAKEGELLLKKTWVFVGLRDEVPEVGSYKPVTLWDRGYILANDGTAYHLFTNSCPHRGSEIVSCAGKGTFTCPYHGWAFNSSGKVSVFNPKLFETVDSDLKLHSIKCSSIGNFIFATTECPLSLSACLGEYSNYLHFVSQQMKQRIDTNAMTVNANWKIVVENTLEWYHNRCVHADSLNSFFAGSSEEHFVDMHSTVIEKFTTSFESALKKTKKVFFGESEFNDYRHTLIFPNLTIATSGYTNFFIQHFGAKSADACDFVSHGFLPQFKSTVSEGAKKQFIESAVTFNRRVFDEDKVICEKVQKGLKNVHELVFDLRPSFKEKRLTKFVTDVQLDQSEFADV
jgi:phenylpropionate dioxygenase-like ring-hydroxylating dioxygenase large terminal subunit